MQYFRLFLCVRTSQFKKIAYSQGANLTSQEQSYWSVFNLQFLFSLQFLFTSQMGFLILVQFLPLKMFLVVLFIHVSGNFGIFKNST